MKKDKKKGVQMESPDGQREILLNNMGRGEK